MKNSYKLKSKKKSSNHKRTGDGRISNTQAERPLRDLSDLAFDNHTKRKLRDLGGLAFSTNKLEDFFYKYEIFKKRVKISFLLVIFSGLIIFLLIFMMKGLFFSQDRSGGLVSKKQEKLTPGFVAQDFLQGIVAGRGIVVGSGQKPIISNIGVLSLGGETGALSLTAGTGISISGTTITSTVTDTVGDIFRDIKVGSDTITASGSTDSLILAAGTGINLLSDTGTKTVTITSTGGNSSSLWDQTSGSLYPLNSTVDLIIGGQSSTSAKFAILNVNETRGTQVASLSGSLTLDSSTASIQTTNNQLLIIGGNATGDVQFKPGNSTSGLYLQSTRRAGIGTTTPTAKLDLSNLEVPIGSELVTNGTFTGSATGWVLGNCVAYNSNNITLTDSSSCTDNLLYTSIVTEAGKTYLLTFTLSGVSGYPRITYGFGNGAQTVDSDGPFTNGTHSIAFTTNYTGLDQLYFNCAVSCPSGDTWTMDDVSIKEVNPIIPALSVTGYDGSTWLSLGSNLLSNTALGRESLSQNSSGIHNTAIGDRALYSNVNGRNNTAVGTDALLSNTSSGLNTALGASTLTWNTTGGILNTAVGAFSLYQNLGGGANTAVGVYSLYHNTTASDNTAIGYGSLYSNTTGPTNTANGYFSLYSNVTGASNVAMGEYSLYASTGGGNTAIGGHSLFTNTSGTNNTAIGYLSDTSSTNLSKATAIGYNAKVGASNSLVLGGTGVDAVKVGIGVASPLTTLDVRALATSPQSVASFTGTTKFAAVVANNDGTGDLFTASKSGLPIFTVKNNGQLVVGAPYYTATCTLKTDSTGLITCGADNTGSGGNSPFSELLGAIVPNNSTEDLLIGGQSSTSAKFALLNINATRGTQTASISGSIILDSSTAGIQTTNNQLLTIGGITTGDIQFKPGNSSTSLYLTSSGKFGFGTTSPLSTFDVRGNSGTLGVASVSGTTSFAALVANNNGVGDLFTASKSGASKFTVKNNGTIIANNYQNCTLKTDSAGLITCGIDNVADGSTQLDYVENTGGTTITATTEASSTTHITGNAVTYDGATTIWVEAYFNYIAVTGVNALAHVILFEDGSSIGELGAVSSLGSSTQYIPGALMKRKLTPSAGSHTYSIRGYKGSGTVVFSGGSGGNGANMPAFMRITTAGTTNSSPFSVLSGAIVANNITEDFLFGSQASSSARFKLTANNAGAGTLGVASISGQTSFASLVVNNDGIGDLFTASASGWPRFTIRNNGNVEVKGSQLSISDASGTGTYGSERITFDAGNYYVLNGSSVGVKLVNGATAWAAQSDIRLKDIIEPITNGIEKILQINPIIYRFKSDKPGMRRSGIIAQEIQKVLPEAVSEGSDGYLSVRYEEIIPLIISAIKDQQAQIASNSARISEISSQLANSDFLGGIMSATLSANFTPADSLDLQDATISGDLMVLGRTTLMNLGVTGKINSGFLVINGLDDSLGTENAVTTINTLAGDLYLQNEGLGGINILAGKVKIDNSGNITTQGVLNAGTVSSLQYEVKGSSSIGDAIILQGQTQIEVSTSSMHQTSKVFIAPTTLTSVPLSVTSKQEGKFVVKIPSVQAKDISFDWWIVGNK